MRNLNELEMVYPGKLVNRPSPSDYEISVIENLVGGLPKKYLEFLMFSNGGRPKCSMFYYHNNEGSKIEEEVEHFYHLLSDFDSTSNLVWRYKHFFIKSPKELLPIANNGFGDEVCLHVKNHCDHGIFFIYHDDPQKTIYKVAESFEEFIDMLEEPYLEE